MQTALQDVFGGVIYAYTRAQAIADGVLVDVSETAREAGITMHTALTAAVWAECVAVPAGLEGEQDEAGRLWDVLWMFRCAVKAGRGGSEMRYTLRVRKREGLRVVTLKAVCGPADDASPCITIMQPDED